MLGFETKSDMNVKRTFPNLEARMLDMWAPAMKRLLVSWL